jgi:hypothetical protein
MVRVKRGGKFVTVKPGTGLKPGGGRPGITVPRKSSGGGSSSQPKKEEQPQAQPKDTVVESQGQKFSVRPAEQQRFKQQQAQVVQARQSQQIQDRRVSEVQPAPQATGTLDRGEQFFQRKRDEVKTAQARGQSVGAGTQFLGTFGAGVATSVIGTARFGKELATKPISTATGAVKGGLDLGARFFRGERFPQVGQTLKQDPGFAGGFVAGEIATAVGAGATGAKAGKTATRVSTRLDPGFVPVKEGKLNLRTGEQIEVVGSFKDFGESVPSQARRAGEIVQPVSAQRDLFSNIFQRQKTVDKPKPTPSSPELERAFFADPQGRLRPSRLFQEESRASPVDLLSGDFSLKGQRPQALVFPEQKTAVLPSNLKDVDRALKQGRQLTSSQAKRFEEFQMTPTGEFKPVGFISREPEITLAPGEIIQRGGRLGVTEINGRRVNIIRAEVQKLPGPTKRRKIDLDSKAGIKEFEKTTGFKSSDILPARPSLSRSGTAGFGLSRGSSRRKSSRSSRPRPSSPSQSAPSLIRDISSPSRGSPSISKPSRGGSSSLTRQISPSLRQKRIIPRTPGIIKPIAKPLGFGSKFKPAKIKQPRGGFSVSLRRFGEFRSLGTGLTKSQAISRGVKGASTTLGASIKIEGPTKITQLPGFRKSKKEKNVFIEPRKKRLSTKGEIKEIQKAKIL